MTSLVGFAVTLAPVLGSVVVPKYLPLVDAFPSDMRVIVIIFSGTVLSVVAIVAQMFLNEKFSKKTLHVIAAVVLLLFLFSLGMLIREMFLGVVRMDYDGGDGVAAVIVGVGERPSRCDKLCSPEESDAECVQDLTTKPSQIASCWGDSRIASAKLMMVFYYLTVMATVLGLVALLMAKERGTG